MNDEYLDFNYTINYRIKTGAMFLSDFTLSNGVG